MADFVLHNYFRSSTSHRVRIALAIKAIPYEYRPVNLLSGDQFNASYNAINPSAEVPTLVHCGREIGQSMAIIEYLDAIEPKKRLFPSDPYKGALVRQFCETINSGIHSYQNRKTLVYLEKECGLSEEKRQAWLSEWVGRGLQSLEAQLKKHAGKFCFGDEITAADVFLVPQMVSAQRFNIALAQYPTAVAIEARCQELPEFQIAHPFRQPDTPADLRQAKN